MKRFMVFAGYDYYPSGGMNDFIDSYDTLEAAKQIQINDYDWADIVDHQTNNRWHFVNNIWKEGPHEYILR